MKTLLPKCLPILLMAFLLSQVLAARGGSANHIQRSRRLPQMTAATTAASNRLMNAPVVNLGANITICSNSVLKLDAGNAGAVYLWSTGETTQTILVDYAGDYWVKVTSNGMSASDTITVSTEPALAPNFDWTTSGNCLPQSVAFSDRSETCGVTIESWNWDFGDGSSSTDHNPVHAYTGNGRYTVRLVVKDNLGNSRAKNKLISITATPSPIVNLGADINICSGAAISLDAGNSGAAYLWNTGETTQQIQPGHDGIYSVQVTKDGCSSRDDVQVTFKPGGAANFVWSIASGDCLPKQVQFNDNTTSCSNAITAWNWDFGDGSSASVANPTHLFTANGIFHITLSATDQLGKVYTIQKDVRIESKTPLVHLGDDIFDCTNYSVVLNAGTLSGASYNWNTGETSQQITVKTGGSYNVTVTKDGCSSQASVNVAFGRELFTDFSWDIAPSACIPKEVHFSHPYRACFESFRQSHWDFGDGTTGSGESPVHVYKSAGNYIVTMTSYDADNNLYAGRAKTVLITGSSLSVDLGPDQTVCTGNAVQLNAGVDGATYNWSNGETSKTISATTAGQYIVIVNKDGCSVADTASISLLPAFNEAFDWTLPAKVCLPANVQFTDQSIACGTITKWFWDFGDGTHSALQHPTHYFTANGHYNVQLTITDQLGNETSLQREVVIESMAPALQPAADVTAFEGRSVILTAAATGDTYQWSTGETTPSIAATHQGDYWVEVSANGCSARDTIFVRFTTPFVVAQQQQADGKCLPVKVAFSDATTILDARAPLTKYIWDFGDGHTSPGADAQHAYDKEGTYTVTLSVTNANGITKKASKLITIENTPPVLQLPADTTVCKDAHFQFAAQDAGAVYTWYSSAIGDQPASNQPFLHVTAPVDVRVSATKCTVTIENIIKISTIELAVPVIAEQNGKLSVTGHDGLAYQWMYNGQLLVNDMKNNSITPAGAGIYHVLITNTAGCAAMSSDYFYLPGGGTFIADGIRIKLSPNPSQGQFKILMSALPATPVRITIFNTAGLPVYTGSVSAHTKDIDLTSVARGMYYAEFFLESKRITIPLVIN